MWNSFAWPRNYGRWNIKVESSNCLLLIGNSRWHWAVRKNSQWDFFHTKPDSKHLTRQDISSITWASVGALPNQNTLNAAKQIQLNDIPLKKLPKWLGIDRALAGWEAFRRAKISGKYSSGLLIVDSGTILSLTRISANGEFAGGQLLAGLRLQLSAMYQGAYNLKKLNQESTFNIPTSLFPTKTTEAMKRGSLQALVGAIVEASKQSQMPIWLCGGDAPMILNELQAKYPLLDLTFHPNLVLEGMIHVTEQN